MPVVMQSLIASGGGFFFISLQFSLAPPLVTCYNKG